MNWTKIRPTKPGHYWFRSHPSETPTLIRICKHTHGSMLCNEGMQTIYLDPDT